MKNNLNIDELLKQSFLELDPNNPANDHLFDMASRNAFETDWSKQNSNNNPSGNSVSVFKNWKFYLSVIGSAGILGAGLYFMSLYGGDVHKKTAEGNLPVKEKTIDVIKEKNNFKDVEQKNLQITSPKIKSHKLSYYAIVNTQKSEAKKDTLSTAPVSPIVTENQNTPDIDVSKEPNLTYRVFSEREKSIINEQLNQLTIRLTSGLIEEFPMIPGAAGSSNGRTFQMAFYMWPTETTVAEYKLFLNDLLLKGRNEEFEKFRPNMGNNFGYALSTEDIDFFHQYFSDPKYDDYPVVFVSPEGADAYCKWIQDLIKEVNTEKNKSVTVRLPSKLEWERAAAGGKEHVEFATTDGKLINGMLHHTPQANYRDYQKNNLSFAFSGKRNKEKHQVGIFNATTPVKSFKANPYGLYDMSGNVSEMVVDINGKVIVKGGNWNSSKEFLRVKDDDFNEFPNGATASPFIGFRPIVNFK